MSIHVDFGLPNKHGFNVHFNETPTEVYHEIPGRVLERDKLNRTSQWLSQPQNTASKNYNAIKRYYDDVKSGILYDDHPSIIKIRKEMFNLALAEEGILGDTTGFIQVVSDNGGAPPADEDE